MRDALYRPVLPQLKQVTVAQSYSLPLPRHMLASFPSPGPYQDFWGSPLSLLYAQIPFEDLVLGKPVNESVVRDVRKRESHLGGLLLKECVSTAQKWQDN